RVVRGLAAERLEQPAAHRAAVGHRLHFAAIRADEDLGFGHGRRGRDQKSEIRGQPLGYWFTVSPSHPFTVSCFFWLADGRLAEETGRFMNADRSMRAGRFKSILVVFTFTVAGGMYGCTAPADSTAGERAATAGAPAGVNSSKPQVGKPQAGT